MVKQKKSGSMLLRERALQLAQTKESTGTTEKRMGQMIGFQLTPIPFCLDFSLVREVLTLKELTIIPGVPEYIQGIINIRGQVMSLINLRKFLEIRESGLTEQNKVIVVHHQGLELAILVDKIDGVISIDEESIDKALPTFGGHGTEFVRGITREGVVFLDIKMMLESKKILIQHGNFNPKKEDSL